MAGPKIPWRAGRIDGFAKDATPDGRLPDATQGADHLRTVSQRLKLSLLIFPNKRPPLSLFHSCIAELTPFYASRHVDQQ